jgi:hypothetical protein
LHKGLRPPAQKFAVFALLADSNVSKSKFSSIFLLYLYHCQNCMHQQFECHLLCTKMHCYSNTAAFTVTVFTNHSVLFVSFSVPTGFSPYTSHTVHIRMVKHTAKTSLTEALIVKLHRILIVICSTLYTRST